VRDLTELTKRPGLTRTVPDCVALSRWPRVVRDAEMSRFTIVSRFGAESSKLLNVLTVLISVTLKKYKYNSLIITWPVPGWKRVRSFYSVRPGPGVVRARSSLHLQCIKNMGVNHGGTNPPRIGSGGTLIQIVPPDFCHVSKFQAPDCLHYYAVKCTS
jgi:hypothetical protein